MRSDDDKPCTLNLQYKEGTRSSSRIIKESNLRMTGLDENAGARIIVDASLFEALRS